jgi:spore maturation protein CgeB
VFVASDVFAADLAERVAPPVRSLHQATDPDRFFPERGGPGHELLFVGNSRRVRRPILDALAGTPHDLAVYGGNWTPDLLDPRRLRGDWIPNDDLRRYYSSAGIVLSDHWPDMRDEGFISNRVYDALACGAFVLSDAVFGIGDEFDGGLATYEDPDELEGLVESYLADPDERRRRADRGRAAVLARHTFAHRVDAIIAATEPLLRARGVASS